MPDKLFSHLSPILFLQTFVAQSIEVSAKMGGGKGNDRLNYIEQLGLTASGCFETAYRQKLAQDGPLDHDKYADMIVEIKNKIGGNFSRASSEPGMVRVVNTRCPFGEAVMQAPELCKMTSSVFGGIAARNFGYAKVILDKRIAMGDGVCEARIYTDLKKAASFEGDEYHREQGVIRGRATTVKAHITRELRQGKTWCGVSEPEDADKPPIVAKSLAMLHALEIVKVVAPTSATVLITGETGVGKEVIARRIHAVSERRNRNFVAVNCGAIPENLVETTLFGHERGAFTGAYEVHHGLFEQAEGGSLFLDEIDSLPLAAQARLLRVLQGSEFERVGGKQRLSTNVRVIAAASMRLDKFIAEGTFRTDLYYRINVVPILLPPLRERHEDLLPLVNHILAQLSAKYNKVINALSETAMAQVMQYDWPGNVRELENVLERSFLFSVGPMMSELLLPQTSVGTPASAGQPLDLSLKEVKQRAGEQVEALILKEALTRFRGNVSEVAKSLGLTPRAIHQKINLHSIDPNNYRSRVKLKVAHLDKGK
ncbi:sigma 54-interacting transcriptional regulator [Sulfurirhabdus autotrophica]|uniref:Nif-specific regulatory protein/two-component system response regulator AtoC n=3 Tax=Sulfurirhabdus autotrophica TaxID=1706046 RepID=A0A4V2W1X0_9PROT|nr:sigma 54-interacting transcriptional regulator [Sulfurirhabdus autotrophica]TCV85859.1 Nif-specific regulatory protein/two-component system response regulator AtoC [Sulfurirhabdus autotrophica]